ncbi:MAG: HEAT repeat domain-containing protein [Planctomycetes bacterium]|nr:HEAT repeat domain-containing protein [Planctomycetota bacterium]
MSRLSLILALLLAVCMTADGAAAQTTIGGGSGGVNVGGKGGGHKKIEPADTTGPRTPPPGGGEPAEPMRPWDPPGATSFPPPPSFGTVGVPGLGITRMPDLLEDDSEWLWWWRLHRWHRLEGPGPPESGPVVTPGSALTALPAPGPPAPQGPKAAALVVPLLLEAWEAEPVRAEMRSALLLGLARAGRGPAVGAALRAGLRDRDLRVVETAALGLGILGEPHAIPVLASLVRDDRSGREALDRHEVSRQVRSFAAYGLGLIAARTRYHGLRATIADALLDGLADQQVSGPDLGTACVHALGLFPGEDAVDLVPGLLGVLRDPRQHDFVRAAAATSVAKLLARAGDSALAREALRKVAKSLSGRGEDDLVRASCALALGRLGSIPQLAPLALEPVLDRFHRDNDPRVRHLATIALGEIGSGTHPSAQIEALPALLAGLSDGPDRDRGWCAVALAWAALLAQEDGRALPLAVPQRILASYPDRNRMRHRAAAGLALGVMRHHPAESALGEALDEVGHPGLRAELVAGLALLAGPQVLDERVPDELSRLDPLRPDYQAACLSLARRAPGRLLQVLIEGGMRSTSTYQGEYAAAIGLGWLVGEMEAIPPLLDLWKSGRAPFEVEVAAVLSLGRVAEPEGPRWNAGYLDLVNPFAAPLTLVGTPHRPGVCDRL